jgi:hypothetical protein
MPANLEFAPSAPPPPAARRAEVVYFDEADVIVTSHRIVIGGEAFAVRDVSAARTAARNAGPLPPPGVAALVVYCAASILFLTLWALDGEGSRWAWAWLLPALLCLGGAAAALALLAGQARELYRLRLVAKGRSFDVLETRSRPFADRVQRAIHRALTTL